MPCISLRSLIAAVAAEVSAVDGSAAAGPILLWARRSTIAAEVSLIYGSTAAGPAVRHAALWWLPTLLRAHTALRRLPAARLILCHLIEILHAASGHIACHSHADESSHGAHTAFICGCGLHSRCGRAFDKRVLDEIAENKDRIKEVGISYVDTPEPMHELAAKIKEINPEINVLVAETSPIIATHAGNGAYAILYYLE